MQNILKMNENKRYRRPQKNTALLSGILRCKECGSYMRPKIYSNRFDEQGDTRYSYMCELKEQSRRGKCNCKNVNGNKLDKLLMEKIKELIAPNEKIYEELKKITNSKSDTINENYEILQLKKAYEQNQNDLDRLIQRIKYVDIELIDGINKEVKKIKKENEEIEIKLKELRQNQQINSFDTDVAKIVMDIIKRHFEQFDKLDIIEKRNFLKLLIDSAFGNGENVEINLLNTTNNESTFLKSNLFPVGEYSK